MQCKQASEMMSEQLDGRLDDAESAQLDEHLVSCSVCQAKWLRLQVVDSLLASAPTAQPSARMRVQVMARLSRRDQARRAIVGTTSLAFATVALTLIALAPILLNLLETLGIAPVLISGGPATLTSLLSFSSTIMRTLLLITESLTGPLIVLSLCGLVVALALNGVWIGALRRLRATR